MDLDARLQHVASRADLVEFIQALRGDLQAHPAGWENPTLETFLEALAAWTVDLGGLAEGRGQPVPPAPTWRFFAEMLLAARIYE